VSRTTGVGGRVPRGANHVGNDYKVTVPATAGGDRPKNLGIVKDIDVLVDHHDVLDPAVYAESGDDCLSPLPRGGFLDLDVGVKAATARGRQVDVFRRGHRLFNGAVKRPFQRDATEMILVPSS